MKRAGLVTLVAATFALPHIARADDIVQDNQVMFGVMGAYVPQQNDLQADVAGVGTYASFMHTIDILCVGIRLGMLYGWLPGGAPGQQWLIEPDVFVGLRWKVNKPLALRAEIGSGPMLNGGEGFSTAVVAHLYTRGAVEVTVVKSVTIEAFVGPSFVLGSTVAGGFAEFGLGCGWKL